MPPAASAPGASTPLVTPSPAGVAPGRGCDLGVGPRRVVVSDERATATGLVTWPDGIFGVVKNGERYSFYAANATSGGGGFGPRGAGAPGGAISRITGTLDDPTAAEVRTTLPISGLKAKLDYLGGGPIYRDPQSGMLLLFYHAERWPGGRGDQFWASYGIAKSTDSGDSWLDLGEFYTPEVPFSNDLPAGTSPFARAVATPAAGYAIVNGFFYVYAKDRSAYDQPVLSLTVARAPVTDVLRAALADGLVPWRKYYQGQWDEPGLSGKASQLEPGNPQVRNSDVAWNSYAGRYVMVIAGGLSPGRDGIYLIDSADGVNWSPRRLIEDEPAEKLFPTLVGLGDDPRVLGAEFYLYYPPKFGAGGRVRGLIRRTVSCNASVRARATLTVSLSDPGAARAISGRLLAGGQPVSGAPVHLYLETKDGPGRAQRITVSGTVPTGATRAFANLNFLRQSRGTGAIDVSVYSARYEEAGQQRVTNSDFAAGAQGWNGTGGTVAVVSSDTGPGNMMRIRAASAETGLRTSTPFAVTPGNAFTVTFVARVAPSSAAAGWFGVVFQDASGSQVRRDFREWDAVAVDETVRTGADGTFTVALGDVSATRYLLHAYADGDDGRWYSSASVNR